MAADLDSIMHSCGLEVLHPGGLAAARIRKRGAVCG